MSQQKHLVFRVMLLTLLLSGCNRDFAGMAEQRMAYSRVNQSDIEIVAIQDLMGSNYVKGILTAADEINQRPGKLLGRSLKVNIEQERSTVSDTKKIVRRIVANPRITAVLGHRSSSVAIPASVIYDRSQIIFMPPFSTAKSLTGHNFDYVFRMVPSNKIMAEQLAHVAKTLGIQNIVVLYARDELSRELAFLFENAALKQGINLVKRSSFYDKETNYRPTISQFSSETFEAVFIASPAAPAALMATQLREMGIEQPILGNDSLNHLSYKQRAGEAAENTIVPSIYRPDKNSIISQKFLRHYQAKYNTKPDYNAAQGYDSLMLLVAAIEQAGSTLAPLLSSTLHFMPAWVGVTGIHAYDQTGEMQGKKYFFKVVKEGELKDLPAIHVPYLLERFEKGLKDSLIKSSIDRELTDFSKVFTERLHEDDHKTYLLDLAQEILGFKRIGIIYENTVDGRRASDYPLLAALASRKELTIIHCEIPFSILEKTEIEQAIIACYGKLSLEVDAMYIPPYRGIDSKLSQQLNSSLAFFKIPAISLDERNDDPNISLVLGKRSDVDQQSMNSMQVYNNLLNGLKVHEFSEHLQSLPEITPNLSNLQRYGLPDKAILDLSPDGFLYSDDRVQSQAQGKP
ncbi:MAG: Extracellular ligand-binding receptor [uncultured Thiotrichaceae bacterium]|uniref:Extracellular ligand-binding receptor n=1 Tax=uncultured Thiotrichaceae bacterium TaxID=298394 RepID=A0A6S6UGS8_9GAMM|nr:MAG: Extracellular ligand-binding receptor [uncultured Thiotrichaceae bacterium]